eukprot:147600-Rhodomonas_salina.2
MMHEHFDIPAYAPSQACVLTAARLTFVAVAAAAAAAAAAGVSSRTATPLGVREPLHVKGREERKQEREATNERSTEQGICMARTGAQVVVSRAGWAARVVVQVGNETDRASRLRAGNGNVFERGERSGFLESGRLSGLESKGLAA